jgi:hypothetical protein
MTLILYWLLTLWAGLCVNSPSEPQQLDIYLAIGQSNMAGRAPIEGQLKDVLSGVYLFKGAGPERWVPASNPMNIYSTVRKEADMQQLSPSFAFAREMAEKGSKEMGMVVNARGGTSIKLWLPGTEYYAAFMERLTDAAKDGEVKGVIWHQGESDVQDASQYLQDLQELINHIRKDLGNPQLPFVAGQIIDNTPERKAFNQLILQLPQLVPHVAVVGAEGLEVFDGVHFDTESQLKLGERYSAKMLELQGQQ